MRLGYSENDSNRYAIGDTDLHCGDVFQIKDVTGKWMTVRIEMNSNGWYLIDTDGKCHDMPFHAVEARFID